jgi:hypothetical protein
LAGPHGAGGAASGAVTGQAVLVGGYTVALTRSGHRPRLAPGHSLRLLLDDLRSLLR